MLISTFKNIEISAISCAVPEQEVSAAKVYKEHRQEYTEKIKKTIAVDSIRRSVKKQISSDLGYIAAKKIIEDNQIDPLSIGILVYVTQSPDYRLPATSCILHKRLGLSIDCATVDVNNGCAGFVYGAHIICSMLNTLNCKNALLIIGDTTSPKKRYKEYYGNRVSVPFGDATASVLFSKKDTDGQIDISLRTNGNGYKSIIEYNGAYRSRTYTSSEMNVGYKKYRYCLINGIDVFNFSISDVPNHINEFIAFQNKTVSDYDCIVLHQPNLLMIKQIIKKIGADMDKVPISLSRYGNTSGASIPLTLVDRYGKNKCGIIKTLFCGFGVGLLWGTMSAKIDTRVIKPMIFSDKYYVDPDLDTYEYN